MFKFFMVVAALFLIYRFESFLVTYKANMNQVSLMVAEVHRRLVREYNVNDAVNFLSVAADLSDEDKMTLIKAIEKYVIEVK